MAAPDEAPRPRRSLARRFGLGYGSGVARRWKITLLVALGVAAADQWTKLLATVHLTPGVANAHLAASGGGRVESRRAQAEVLRDLGGLERARLFLTQVRNPCDGAASSLCPEVKVIDGFWGWRYAENKGAAWSIFAKADDRIRLPFLIGVSALACVFFLGLVRKLEDHQDLLLWSLALVLGGALGNLIDRAYLGYVIDFIHWYRGLYVFPTFNVADAAITSGVVLMGLDILRDLFRRRASSPGPAETSVAHE